MKPSPTYFFFFLMLCGMPVLYGQDPSSVPPVQTVADGKVKAVLAGADSLGNEIAGKTGAVTDSIGNLSAYTEAQIRARMDSLQSKLDSLPLDFARGKQAKTAGQIAKGEGKAGALTRKIDSLQRNLQGFGNPGGLRAGDKLDIGKVKVPELKSISGVNLGGPGTGAGDIINSRIYSGISLLEQGIPGGDLTKRIDEQIRNWGGKAKGYGAQAGRLRQYKGQYSQMIKDPSQIDQLADSQASQISELKELGAQTEELEALKGLPEEMLADLKRYQNEQALKEELKNRAVQKAADYFAGHMDKVTKAQSAMSELKKKYSYVPDSRDLSTAVKNTSLKNEPLKRRFRYGLGFQIHRTDPVSLDLSPNVQYRFNPKISVRFLHFVLTIENERFKI